HVVKRIKFTDTTINQIAKEHEDADWNWGLLGSRGNRSKTPLEDWIKYSSAFYSDLVRAFEKKPLPRGVWNFPEECKEYSAILGNWILNNHLLFYSRLTRVVPVVMA